MAEKVGVWPTTGLFEASLRIIVTVDDALPSASTGPVPVMLEFAAEAVADVKTTVPPDLIIGESIERVFVSAVEEVIVQVDAPVASVAEHNP